MNAKYEPFGIRSLENREERKAKGRSAYREMRRVNMSIQGIEYKRFTHDPTAVIDSEKTDGQMNGQDLF